MPANRVSSQPCRGAGTASLPPPVRSPLRQASSQAFRAFAAVHAPYFIGRAEPLSRLHRAWDIACSGKRAIVWVAGEPGIGKTTLIEHFVATLGDVAVARGQCVEHYGAGEPYLPVLEALSELCRNDSTLVALLRAVAPTWLLQLPWLSTADEREALRRELAGVSPDRMLREMGEVLDRSGERRPLLLVTEDLHWSDRATIQLIDYVARRRGSARLMWLASFRLAEVVALDHPLNPLRHELRLHDLCEEIVLDPFSEREVADYVAERSPAIASDEAFVRALHERTDGLPLFIASIMSEMSARAAQSGGRVAPEQVAKIAVPENLAAIIEHYIAKLENEQRTLLSAAAVCGVQFRVNTIAAALERDAAWVGDTCDQLAREQLWLVAPARRGRQRRGRVAVFVQARAVPPSVVRARGAIGPCTASPENRRCARTRARRRSAGHRGRVGDALRASRRGDGRRALLRRSRRSRSCELQPGRVHEDHRTCVAAARAGARWSRAQRTANHDRNASRPCRYPSAWRGQRSKERAPASVLAARRSSAASDARAPASRIRVHALPARGICRGARGGRSGGSAWIDDE